MSGVKKGSLLFLDGEYFIYIESIPTVGSERHHVLNVRLNKNTTWSPLTLNNAKIVSRGMFCDLNITALIGRQCAFQLSNMMTSGRVIGISYGSFRCGKDEIQYPIEFQTVEGPIHVTEVKEIWIRDEG